MNIVLTGFMGTGKSAVGRYLAEHLKVPFVDSDEALQKQAGRSIRSIFEQDGEAAFRALESKVVAELASHDRTVIATGGGVLLNPANRDALRRTGILVCLTAKVGTLLERMRGDLSRPLLAGGDPQARIEGLLQEREAVYAQCEIQVSTDGKTIAEVAQTILSAIGTRWS